jgi:hypothetical protein
MHENVPVTPLGNADAAQKLPGQSASLLQAASEHAPIGSSQTHASFDWQSASLTQPTSQRQTASLLSLLPQNERPRLLVLGHSASEVHSSEPGVVEMHEGAGRGNGSAQATIAARWTTPCEQLSRPVRFPSRSTGSPPHSMLVRVAPPPQPTS